MRNRDNSLTGKIIKETESLPYFTGLPPKIELEKG